MDDTRARDADPNVNIIIREPGHVEYAGSLGLGVYDLAKITGAGRHDMRILASSLVVLASFLNVLPAIGDPPPCACTGRRASTPSRGSTLRASRTSACSGAG